MVFKTDKTINIDKVSVCSLPSSDDSVLGSEAMNRSVLHAESNHSLTLSIFHQQIQGKVLNKVAGVITKRLNRRQRQKLGLTGLHSFSSNDRVAHRYGKGVLIYPSIKRMQ